MKFAQNLMVLSILALSGCTSEPAGGSLSAEFKRGNAVRTLQHINNLAHKCWIKSGDKSFKGLALIPELDTRSGTARILIVPKGKAQGLPQMVIAASSTPVKIDTYGPLVNKPISSRINKDIIAWNTGKTGC